MRPPRLIFRRVAPATAVLDQVVGGRSAVFLSGSGLAGAALGLDDGDPQLNAIAPAMIAIPIPLKILVFMFFVLLTVKILDKAWNH